MTYPGKLLALLATLLLALSLPAEDLHGGLAGSHGRVPRFVLTKWVAGGASSFQFSDLPTNTKSLFGIMGNQNSFILFPGIGHLTVDPLGSSFQVFPVPTGGFPIAKLPTELLNLRLVYQGLYLDGGNNTVKFTDGTLADFFNPLVMVCNSRQSSNSISVIDPAKRQVVQRLTNSENGYVAYSPNRSYAFVCEPGLQRNRVVMYDLRGTTIKVVGYIPVSGGIRYGCAMPIHGRNLYVPVHDGIAVIDMIPTSPMYMKETKKITTSFTGTTGAIFTGPLDLAITPDGRKLYIAYGETVNFPAKSHVGVVDLYMPTLTERLIPVTTGGVFTIANNVATRPRIKISYDGLTVYTVEYGLNPATLGAFIQGFKQGALVNVISTVTDKEIAVIPTQGFDQQELAVGRLGRNVWVAQQDKGAFGHVLRIDVGPNSPQRFKVIADIRIDPTPYSSGAGPKGIDVSPDSSTVFVSVVEDKNHTVPQVITLDALTNKVVGAPITVESLCHSLTIQQR